MLMAFILLSVSWLAGEGLLRLLYGKNRPTDLGWTDQFLTGGMVIVGLAEAAHLGTLFLRRSFSDCLVIFLCLTAVCLLLGLACFLKRRKAFSKQPSFRNGERDGRLQGKMQLLYLVFGALLLSQMIMIGTRGAVYRSGDMTVETVNSILESNTIYRINPMTGKAFEAGMPLRLRILCLPTLYSIFCRLFSASAVSVVWVAVPICTLTAAYFAYRGLSLRLFGESGVKAMVFLIFVALLFWSGTAMYGLDGFGVLHSGFRGVVIRNAVLLPFTFDLCMRKRWKLVVLCILAEGCMVWTFYGMGACLFVAAGMFLLQKLFHKKQAGTDGKETSPCRSF